MLSFLRSILSSLRRPTAPKSRCMPRLEGLESREVPAVNLGAAGDFGVLGLNNTEINANNATVTGDVGVSRGGQLTAKAHATVTGEVHAFSRGLYSGPGKLSGVVKIDPTLLGRANADARNASSEAAALTPTQVVRSVNQPITLTGNGGLNVISVRGDVKQSITLTGGPNDVFIINISGSLDLGGKEGLGVAGGVTAGHVLYNITGSNGVSTKANTSVHGTILAPRASMDLNGTFVGGIIGGGRSIALSGRTEVREVPFAAPSGEPTPEPTPTPVPPDVMPPTSLASLSGHVYYDGDMSGARDASEAGLANWMVMLSGTDSVGNAVSLSATTGDDGSYSFTGLEAGTYQISVMQMGAWSATGPSMIESISLSGGQQGTGHDFGEVLLV
jgi:hypothetical protein